MTYLDRIVVDVRRRLEERRARVPLRELQARGTPTERGSLADVLRMPGIALIAEVERATLSKGYLGPGIDVSLLVQGYVAAGAAAISVLTEQDHFRGSLSDLEAAAEATGLPLLRKDFILDEYQLHEARVFGASAILLIAALLDDSELAGLHRAARSLGLDVLVEVHDEEELRRALAMDEAVISVNNRDLHTFRVSLETTFRVISRTPPERLVVSEGGVRSPEDVVRLATAGVDGVLLGDYLVRSDDPAQALRDLRKETVA